MRRPAQPSLFDAEPEPDRTSGSTAGALDLAAVHARAAAIAARVPHGVHFGTSSWSFPGWRGLVYSRDTTTSALARDGLREYAHHPLLTTVGIDRSYYAPIPDEDLLRYAEQLPQGFFACAKAPASVTSPVVYEAPPARRPAPNPTFLSAERLIAEQLEPFERAFAQHTGPFVLEFPPAPRTHPVEPGAFIEGLDRLLGELPRTFEYAVELRDRAVLTPAYARVLARHGASHVYNYWSFMPMPEAQTRVVPPEDCGVVVVRLLLRPGTRYDDQRESFRPFNRIVEPDAEMRRQVCAIARRGAAARKRVYVLVNNKAEGSAPLTIEALAADLAAGR